MKKAILEENEKYISTGITGFDDLLKNGIPKGSSILVAGGAGSGKTTFCLQILAYHLFQGKNCYFMGFKESQEKLFWISQKKKRSSRRNGLLSFTSFSRQTNCFWWEQRLRSCRLYPSIKSPSEWAHLDPSLNNSSRGIKVLLEIFSRLDTHP